MKCHFPAVQVTMSCIATGDLWVSWRTVGRSSPVVRVADTICTACPQFTTSGKPFIQSINLGLDALEA